MPSKVKTMRWALGPMAIAMTALVFSAGPGFAQQRTAPAPDPAGGWVQGTDVKPQPPAGAPAAGPPSAAPGLKGTQTDPKASQNTTVIQRASPEGRGQSQLALEAVLTDEGQPIDQGLVWRIFRDKPGLDGKHRPLSEHKDASPILKLDPGDYLVNVAFGRAHLTRRIAVQAGRATAEKFVLNAGGLKLIAQLASGAPAPERSVAYDILSDERDQFGNRTKIMIGARPGLIIRLNAGIYQIVSVYGDANATVRADVAVEPGKLTEATVSHAGAKVTFKLVTRVGGDALADTQWSVTSPQGETIKESVGALPTHILAAGTYVVNARYAGQSFRREFTVQAGDTAEVEVVTR